VWANGVDFTVDRERAIARALATNDLSPGHPGGTSFSTVVALTPRMAPMAEATLGAMSDGLMVRILHGEHDSRLHRPIRAGDTLVVRSVPISVEAKSSRVMETTFVQTRSWNFGDLVSEQYVVGFFQDGHVGGSDDSPTPAGLFDECRQGHNPAIVVELDFDLDQDCPYTRPAGIPIPVRLDDGLDLQLGCLGIIAHGLRASAILAYLLIEHAADGDPTRLTRLAVRFSEPVIPGDAETTFVWRDPYELEKPLYRFESISSAGDRLIHGGLAEFLP
jgi:acyl dehydratase